MTKSPCIVGLDVGGANLKLHSAQQTTSLPFALWQQPHLLAARLAELLAFAPTPGRLALTMTGELCDCFATKRAGVEFILDAVTQAAPGWSIGVWATTGQFVLPSVARAQPLTVAAANWHAQALAVGRWHPTGATVLMDLGSTTTDLIPLRDGVPQPRGWTDFERLHHQELVYTGAQRTPVCAVWGFAGAAEWFATMQDVYVLLDLCPEDAHDTATADQRPRTRHHAGARLLRIICSDYDTHTLADAVTLARAVADRQQRHLATALTAVAQPLPHTVLVSGSGAALAELVVRQTRPTTRIWRLADEVGTAVASAACAWAVATLAAELPWPS
jgi:hypothetical protein